MVAGVEFIDENGGGPGVRLREHQRAKQAIIPNPPKKSSGVPALVTRR